MPLYIAEIRIADTDETAQQILNQHLKGNAIATPPEDLKGFVKAGKMRAFRFAWKAASIQEVLKKVMHAIRETGRPLSFTISTTPA